jgi:hypothetical protein
MAIHPNPFTLFHPVQRAQRKHPDTEAPGRTAARFADVIVGGRFKADNTIGH